MKFDFPAYVSMRTHSQGHPEGKTGNKPPSTILTIQQLFRSKDFFFLFIVKKFAVVKIFLDCFSR